MNKPGLIRVFRLTHLAPTMALLFFTLISLLSACQPLSNTLVSPTAAKPSTTPETPEQVLPSSTPSIQATISSTAPAPFLPLYLVSIEPGNTGSLQQVAEIQLMPISENSIAFGVDFSPDGLIVATRIQDQADKSSSIVFWDLTSGQRLFKSDKLDSLPQVLSFSNGDFLAIIVSYGQPFLWDPASKNKLSLLDSDDWFTAFSPDMEYLVRNSDYDSANEQSLVLIIDARSGKLLHSVEIDAFLMDAAFSTDNSIVALGSGGSVDVLGTTLVNVITGNTQQLPRIGKITFSSDGRLAAGLLDLGEWISVFKTEDWQEQFRLGVGDGTVLDNPAFSPNGHILAAIDSHRLTLWDATNGDVLITIGDPAQGPFSAFAFSPDGKLLATIDGFTIKLWGVVP